MKSAVLLAGHLRNYDRCAKSLINHIVAPLHADLFISTWNTLGFHFWSGHTHSSYNGKDKQVSEAEIRAAYPSVKALNIENFDEKQKVFDGIKKPCWSNKSYSMWHKVLDCYNLCQSHGPYDFIVRARPDTMFTRSTVKLDPNKLHRERILTDLLGNKQDIVYLANSELVCSWNDQFAMGFAPGMAKYCNLYDNLHKYQHWQRDTVEFLVKLHMEANKVKVVFTDAVSFYLTRTLN